MEFIDIWYPIEKFIDKTVVWGIFKIAKEPMYWLRCHTFDRYHVVDISNVLDYKWGYCDAHWKIELMMFRIVIDFVEKEKALENIDWDWDEDHKRVRDTFVRAYRWAKIERKEAHDKMWKIFDEALVKHSFDEIDETKGLPKDEKLFEMKMTIGDQKKYKEFKRLEKEFDEKHDKILKDLFEIREYLWT